MSVESTRTGFHVVTCDDNPHCGERFTSSSQKGVLRKQLEAARWLVTQSRFHAGGLRTICEWHKPKPTVIVMPPKRADSG